MKTLTLLILPALAMTVPALALPTSTASKAEKRDDRLGMVKQHFALLDANHDGYVTKTEVLALNGKQSTDRTEQRFKAADGNHDGMISRTEYSSGGKRGGKTDQNATPYFGTRMFAAADINRDGKMTESEMADNVRAWFDGADSNHDGVLTADERQSARDRNRAAPKTARRGKTV
ncbi:MAG: hypothetical protein RL367_900 [Pseudomonadota bacterium]